MRLLAICSWTRAEPFGAEVWSLRLPQPPDDLKDGGDHSALDCFTHAGQQCLQALEKYRDGAQQLSLLMRIVPKLLDNPTLLDCFKCALAAIGDSGHKIRAVRLYVGSTTNTNPALAELRRLIPPVGDLRIEGCDPERCDRLQDASTGLTFAADSSTRGVVTSIELRNAGANFTTQIHALHKFYSLRSLLISQANNVDTPWGAGSSLPNLQSITLQDIPKFQNLHGWCSANWRQVAPALREIRLIRVMMPQTDPPVDLSAVPGAPALHIGPGVLLPEGSNVVGQAHRIALTQLVQDIVLHGGCIDTGILQPELRALFTPDDAKYFLSHQPVCEEERLVTRSLSLDCAALNVQNWRLEDWWAESPSSEVERLTIAAGESDVGAWMPAFITRVAGSWRPWRSESPQIRLSVTRPTSSADRACLLAAAAIGIELIELGVRVNPVHTLRSMGHESVGIDLHVTDEVTRSAAISVVLNVALATTVSEIRIHIGDSELAEGICGALLQPRNAGFSLGCLFVEGSLRAADVASIIAAIDSRTIVHCDLTAARFDVEALLRLSRHSEIALSPEHWEQMTEAAAAQTAFLVALQAALAPEGWNAGQY